MFMSILSGHVSLENWSNLERSYTKAVRHPPRGLVKSYLIHSTQDARIWKIITLWKSQEAFEECKRLQGLDPCTQMFCDAGSTPDRTTFDVMKQYILV
jgi:hypothetical protein